MMFSVAAACYADPEAHPASFIWDHIRRSHDVMSIVSTLVRRVTCLTDVHNHFILSKNTVKLGTKTNISVITFDIGLRD